MDSKMVVSISSLSFLMTTPLIPAHEDDGARLTQLSLVVFCFNSITYAYLGHFKLSKDFSGFTSFSNIIRIHIEAATFVVISYVSLLLLNWRTIWLAIFPIIAIGFVLALCYKLSHQSDRSIVVSRSGYQEGERETSKTEDQEVAVLVPYLVLCATRYYRGADNMAISQFLLFFSSMLSALSRMMTRLELTGAAPGVASASVLLWKASLFTLLVTVHAFAAELLGENIMLFIVVELAPVLMWFSLNLDRPDNSLITVDEIISNRHVRAAFGVMVAAVGFAFQPLLMNELVVSWCTKAVVTCSVSGVLTYCIVFMLCHWPGLEDSTATHLEEETVKLLKLWAKNLLVAGLVLLSFAFLVDYQLALHEQMVAEQSKIVSGKFIV